MNRIADAREDGWFSQHEKHMIEENRRRRDEEMAARSGEEEEKERQARKREHWLKCPKCGHDMIVASIDEIEVETCTDCGGIYFDRGEIEQLLLRRQDKRLHFYRRLFGLG
jgi:uncharacterized protein